jgi:hypothetical protein
MFGLYRLKLKKISYIGLYMGNAANLLMFKAIPEKIFKIGNLQNLQKMYFRPTEYSETCLNRTLNKPVLNEDGETVGNQLY